ncbi:hypothetical protein PCASD_00916 [Puccinia coronata f. sp. avenae]|uniref:Uncharacterized protein n=1 Tax=Puccinia coronata f. sp. avenae TaxID=200324 RepID=A0A2N5VPP0_9BASI|nr:hypothetical protein PCASD_00916 [Puccinia coronata f. sp. avenae]
MGLTTNDLLEQYQKSPSATRRFKRMDLSGPSPINCSNTPDLIFAQEFDEQTYENFATSNKALDLSPITHTQFLSEDNNGSTSGIDLNVLLDTMAVQLEYQLDLPNGFDSDDESHLLRDNESKFEDESLDSAPLSSLRGLPDCGPSRSSFLQIPVDAFDGKASTGRFQLAQWMLASRFSPVDEFIVRPLGAPARMRPMDALQMRPLGAFRQKRPVDTVFLASTGRISIYAQWTL